MKIINIFLSLLLAQTLFCIESNFIVFYSGVVKVSDGINASGTTVKIQKPGIYLVSGEAEEGNIIVQSNQVSLYLQNLKLSSERTAPITINKNLDDVKIFIMENTQLDDLEDPLTTEGECAAIKVKANSIVHFKNDHKITLTGNCDNIIKGGRNTSIYFDESAGEYELNAKKGGINVEKLLVVNGGVFRINSEIGNGIKVSPDDSDTEILGQILINNGTFIINSYKDAIVAKNNITIVDGNFDIITQNGYNDRTYNSNVSSKGFKVSNNTEGSEIKVYSGNFNLNTADDGFRSNRDITILKGNITIFTRDDGICAKNDLVLGIKDGPLDDLRIHIIMSYEALEGMTIKIYSGRIRVKATNDGINASGPVAYDPYANFNWTRRNYTRGNYTRRNDTNNSNTDWWNIFDWGNGFNWSEFRRNNTNRNRSNSHDSDNTDRNGTTSNTTQRRKYHFFGNDSYYISIFNGEIYVDSDTDGFDSNGNIYIHGGSINVFSSPNGTDNPIDRDGNLTMFNAEMLCVGVKGAGYVHSWIDKGNQLYCFSKDKVSKDHLLQIRNEEDEIVREEMINKDISYIFYSHAKLNNKYTFYIYDEDDNEEQLNITCDYLDQGEDDEDVVYNAMKKEEKEKKIQDKNKEQNGKKGDENKIEDNEEKNISQFLNLNSIYLLLSILLYFN
jgi:hypothetical protein